MVPETERRLLGNGRDELAQLGEGILSHVVTKDANLARRGVVEPWDEVHKR
jgi:hypothetical protein